MDEFTGSNLADVIGRLQYEWICRFGTTPSHIYMSVAAYYLLKDHPRFVRDIPDERGSHDEFMGMIVTLITIDTGDVLAWFGDEQFPHRSKIFISKEMIE